MVNLLKVYEVKEVCRDHGRWQYVVLVWWLPTLAILLRSGNCGKAYVLPMTSDPSLCLIFVT